MLQKDIRAFIKAIRTHDAPVVEQMLAHIPDLANAKAKSPPKKDDGQSPLQIAFKAGNFQAAAQLLAAGANPDYIDESEVNEWNAPVLHDAIMATAFHCKTMCKSTLAFESGLRLIGALVEKGANPNRVDSFGNTGGMRALLDARQMIMHPAVDTSDDGTVSQMRRLFVVLQELGADYDRETETRDSVRKAAERLGLSQFSLLPDRSAGHSTAP